MSRHHHRPEHKRGWTAIRARAIRAAGRRCSRCGFAGKLSVHHPTPLSRGGDNDQALEVVCRNCHLSQHHQPDPDREAWGRYLEEEYPC